MFKIPHEEILLKYLSSNTDEESFYLCFTDILKDLYHKWTSLLPKVQPFYAVKVNPLHELLTLLSEFPLIGFDCASPLEIKSVLDLKVSPSRIIYANPVRSSQQILYAKNNSVNLLTFDSKSELLKIKANFPEANLLLRLTVKQLGSTYALGQKFGVTVKEALELLRISQEMHLIVVGVCFHVGSDCRNPHAYFKAIKKSKKVFDLALSDYGIKLNYLDIGGGFTNLYFKDTEICVFDNTATLIKNALESFFPVEEFHDLKVIAEPGRFFCETAFVIAVRIFARKIVKQGLQVFTDEAEGIEKIMYYINEGTYSQFICQVWSEYPLPTALYTKGKIVYVNEIQEEMVESVFWGPTCDSLDCPIKSIKLPILNEGDWLLFKDFGAYCLSVSSTFNGIPRTKTIFI